MQLLCSMIARFLGSGCGLLLGRQAAWRPGYNRDGVVKVIGGTVQAVAVFSDCVALGVWLRAQARSSSCFAAGVQLGWCRQSWLAALQAVAVNSDCLDFGLWLRGSDRMQLVLVEGTS